MMMDFKLDSGPFSRDSDSFGERSMLKDMFLNKLIFWILPLVYHVAQVDGVPTSVLEELREQIQSGVDLDTMNDNLDPALTAEDRMGPYATSGFQVPAHISTLSNDQISNYLQSRVDSQPHLLSDAQILPGPEVSSEDSREDDNTIFSGEDASFEDHVVSEEDEDDDQGSSKPPRGAEKNRKKHKSKDKKNVSVEVHIDSNGDDDKYLFGASSDTYKFAGGHGHSHAQSNDILMDVPPNWPPEFKEPHKGSVDYVLIPMIMIGIIVPMFVVLYVVVGSFIAKLQPVSLLRKKKKRKRSLGPDINEWPVDFEILKLLDYWTSDS